MNLSLCSASSVAINSTSENRHTMSTDNNKKKYLIMIKQQYIIMIKAKISNNNKNTISYNENKK